MLFLLLTPVVGIVGTALYTYLHGFHFWMPMLALGMYAAVGISICAGYHRFFSHKSYEASRPVQLFFAIFGAMAAQNSILWWSAGHRVHHQYVDHDWDPYNIKRGFWWAHILWIFHHHPPQDTEANTPDLLKNPIVMWQNRWYKAILIVGGFGLPALIGAMFGDPIAGLLWGGLLRLVVIHHTTFFVNSLAHFLGKPTYNADVSARDNWAVALAHPRRGLSQLPSPLPRGLPQRHPLVSLGSGEVVHLRAACDRTGERVALDASAAGRAGPHVCGGEGRRVAARDGAGGRGRSRSATARRCAQAPRRRARPLARIGPPRRGTPSHSRLASRPERGLPDRRDGRSTGLGAGMYLPRNEGDRRRRRAADQVGVKWSTC
jgi:fatty-acid desaturase